MIVSTGCLLMHLCGCTNTIFHFLFEVGKMSIQILLKFPKYCLFFIYWNCQITSSVKLISGFFYPKAKMITELKI
jgi:hypothetical protein